MLLTIHQLVVQRIAAVTVTPRPATTARLFAGRPSSTAPRHAVCVASAAMSGLSANLSGPVGLVANDAKTGAKGAPMTPIPSASLVILCPISADPSLSRATEYATLMVQRKASGSFRSAVVFPGGLLDQADLHATASDDAQLSYLEGLQLCALRETFEETGLLLLPADTPGHSRAIGPQQSGFTTEEWTAARKAVHDDARAFSALLQRVMAANSSSRTLPPLAPLRHHSNWVTPHTLVRPAKRFDTHFWITVLDQADALGQLAAHGVAHEQAEQSTLAAGLTADGSETTSLRLARPSDLLSLAIRDEIILFPPQYYLLSDVDTALRQQRETQQHGLDFAPLYFGEQAVEAAIQSIAPSQSAPYVPPTISNISRVEPQGLPAHGGMISRDKLSSTGGRHGGGKAESNDEDQIFVLPLALPGDVLRPVKGQSSDDTQRRNRVYCTPRSKGEGGGLMVHGAHRRAIPGLLDFRFGHLPAELEGEAVNAEPAAKL